MPMVTHFDSYIILYPTIEVKNGAYLSGGGLPGLFLLRIRAFFLAKHAGL